MNGSALALGSSWAMVYSGVSGLIANPSLIRLGTLQMLANPVVPYTSFRLLVASKRGSQSSAAYSEMCLFLSTN